ncbi:MAG: iron-sulfur cluster insertion protein ErpA [Candidatus Thermofonsia Clade 1 bacterium]|jgi:iron-sulfur cluster assembly protein|uniref:Iron-sulfur cluster insertion protein ErpA n=1 Tax=Candidatus Thermofonsia Clade 1 bacterium TaxID=2364210 RepID=A0A2M8PEC1_9CHLR|nr:MAG: iron-sulfur cluster insertion protein ErpA [Candidatus Thermofonsia Clade 1 bacterium]RMF53810.1 MAG: iron-sulfur cluster insertion protein ErpA [Chloroflexota bacterium]
MADLLEQPNTQTELESAETPVLAVTAAATAKIKELLVARNIPNHALRVFVSGGGCSGLQYGMAFESNPQEYDTVVEVDGVRLVIDPTSLMYIGGATIDYVDSLMGGGFRIDNPNAVSTCGCGTSFKTKGENSAASAGGCGSCG